MIYSNTLGLYSMNYYDDLSNISKKLPELEGVEDFDFAEDSGADIAML
jgi:hypothetical protein